LCTFSLQTLFRSAGTYTPAPPNGDQLVSFRLATGVGVYGGFAGTETRREQRAPAVQLTILSGDLNADDGAGWTGMQDNSDHVVTAAGADASAVLDGFTIRGGYVVNASGAGLWLQGSSCTVRACTVTTCVANFNRGGGVSVTGGGAPAFTDCTFSGNYAHLGRGGGMSVGDTCQVALLRCRWIGNRCTGSSSDANGGAIYLDLGSRLTASECTFSGNVAEYPYGPGFYPASGGAIASLADSLDLAACLFVANRSDAGGALHLYRGTNRLVSCVLNANRAAKQATSGGYGGAVACLLQAVTAFEGCVIYGNSATEDTGGIFGNSTTGTCQLANCLVWGNTDTFGQVSESQVKSTRQHHCCVMNMLVPRPNEDPIDPKKFPQCTDRDPLIANVRGADNVPGTEDDDFRLRVTSPCVDSGDPLVRNVELDHGGALRVVDGNLDGRMQIDMGAHEFVHGTLRVTVTDQTTQRTVRADLSGTTGTLAVLVLGAPAVPLLVPPFGATWFDLRAFLVLPLGALPIGVTLNAPLGSLDLALQGLLVGNQGAQLCNPVTLRLR
jgi:hypothetical protein